MRPDKTSHGLIAGSAVYLASNIFNAAIPFALLPVLTRFLSIEQYGQVAMFQMMASALNAFTGLNTHGAANRKYYDNEINHHQMGKFIGTCVYILSVTSLLILLVVQVFKNTLASWTGLEPRWMYMAVLVSAAGFIANLRLGQWQVRRQATRYGSFQVSRSLADMLLSLLLVISFSMGAGGRIVAQTWIVAIFALFALFLLQRDKLLKLSRRPHDVREALRFGIPLVPHILGIFLLSAVDRFVIHTQLGLGKVGIYMVAAQLAMGMAIVFDAINKAYVPWLFERLQRNREADKKQIVRWTYVYFVTALLVACLAFVFGPFVVPFVAGAQYAQAGKLVGWLALGQGFGGMYLMVTNYIFFSKRTGLLSIATIISGLVNVALLILLVKLYGLHGAAIAFAISMALRFALTWSVAQRRHPMPWFHI